jgi:predicted kinase
MLWWDTVVTLQRLSAIRRGEQMPPKPLLILVSGKPGSGKSTLARRLAVEDALWLPLVSCDPIRNGMLETGVDATGRAAIDAFYGTLEYLLNRGVSLIADLSFRRGLDEAQLLPLSARSRMVNIHCETTIGERGDGSSSVNVPVARQGVRAG